MFFATLNSSVVSELLSLPHTTKCSCPSTITSAKSDGMLWEVKDRLPSAFTETIVEVFHDFLLSTCLNLSSLISLFLFRGRIVWGSVRQKKEKTLRKKGLWKEQKLC